MKWWAYIDKRFDLYVKPFKGEEEIEAAMEDPTLRDVFIVPVEAESEAEAARIFMDIIGGIQDEEKEV